MPNYNREPAEDDLDIAAKVMDTVQRQIATYRDALQTLRRLRKELATREEHGSTEKEPRYINTPQLLAEFFEENGIPKPFSIAMAAEDFAAMEGDFSSDFSEAEYVTFTWDCCCSICCFTCSMATQVTGCPDTFIA